MKELRICIYCRERKTADDFNIEHVIPQAFGLFRENLTLQCVCRECNQHFGDTFDREFARDSVEGVMRFWKGVKPANEFKGQLRRTTVQFAPGASQGKDGFFVATPNGVKVMAFPQIGFEQDGRETLWFREDEVPTRQELVEFGVDVTKAFTVQIREMAEEDAARILTEKGFPRPGSMEVQEPPNEDVDTVTTGIVDIRAFRATAKIAFNYLAASVGAAPTRLSIFDRARAFIRHNVGENIVHVSHSPFELEQEGRPLEGHLVSLQTYRGGLVSQVSIFQKLRYIVHLAEHAGDLLPMEIGHAHFFDVKTKRVSPVPVPRLVPSRPLKAV